MYDRCSILSYYPTIFEEMILIEHKIIVIQPVMMHTIDDDAYGDLRGGEDF